MWQTEKDDLTDWHIQIVEDGEEITLILYKPASFKFFDGEWHMVSMT